MRFYSLEIDVFDSSVWHVGDVQGIDNWRLVSPPVLPMNDDLRSERLFVDLIEDGKHSDVTAVGYAAIPMISFKTLQLISGDDGFTALPVLFSGGEQKDSCYLLHVWDVIDCFDEDQSVFDIIPDDDPVFADRAGEYRSVTRLIIQPERAVGKHVFRVARLLNSIIVSEELKLRLEKAGVTGVIFKSVSG